MLLQVLWNYGKCCTKCRDKEKIFKKTLRKNYINSVAFYDSHRLTKLYFYRNAKCQNNIQLNWKTRNLASYGDATAIKCNLRQWPNKRLLNKNAFYRFCAQNGLHLAYKILSMLRCLVCYSKVAMDVSYLLVLLTWWCFDQFLVWQACTNVSFKTSYCSSKSIDAFKNFLGTMIRTSFP